MVRTRTVVVVALLMVAAAVAFGFTRHAALTSEPAARPIAGLATGRPTMYDFTSDT